MDYEYIPKGDDHMSANYAPDIDAVGGGFGGGFGGGGFGLILGLLLGDGALGRNGTSNCASCAPVSCDQFSTGVQDLLAATTTVDRDVLTAEAHVLQSVAENEANMNKNLADLTQYLASEFRCTDKAICDLKYESAMQTQEVLAAVKANETAYLEDQLAQLRSKSQNDDMIIAINRGFGRQSINTGTDIA